MTLGLQAVFMLPSDKLRAKSVRRQFEKSLSYSGSQFNLTRSALLIAAEEESGVDPAHYLAVLKAWGDSVRSRASSSSQPPLTVLLTFLYQELGFRGNHLAYYDPKNSFLNQVLDRALGIPISLAVVLIAVGRHAGLQVDGVGMPGHFLVRVQEPGKPEPVLVDPFCGERISRSDCQRKLDDLFDGQLELQDEHLSTVTDSQILERILRNLKAVYVRYGLNRRALSIADRILLLAPRSLPDVRDRGTLRATVGDFARAIKDFEFFLALNADGPEVADAAEQLKRAKMSLAGLN
jgi:regulator of sirC expression with transglutaminase-like and TPR domain